MFCKEINLPALDQDKEKSILDCYFNNIDDATNPVSNNIFNYRNLHTFKNKVEFFTETFFGSNINPNYFHHMSIQRTLGETFKPHIDVHRTVTALYTIRGPATTIFYKKDDDNLIPLQSICMDLHKWYLFDNSILDGVENIPNERISLVIDFTKIFGTYSIASNFFL